MHASVSMGQDQPDLAGLLRAAASGDEAAWRQLVELYARRVFALAKSRVRKADVAEEVTQSVFVTVAAKLKTGAYTEQGKFESWLFRVAINRVRDEIRRSRRQALPTDPEAFGQMPGGSEREGEPGAGADMAGMLRRLRGAMGNLSEADREIIELRHHAGLSFAQMAEMLGEPLGTLLARHHRALKKLKGLIGERNGPGSEGDA